MKPTITIILILFSICLSGIETGMSFSFRTPRADTVSVMDYELSLEIISDNMYLEIEKELENGQHYFNYELKANYEYRFKYKQWSNELLRDKIIETPFSIGLSTRTLQISSRNVEFSEVGVSAIYEFKASNINLWVVRYISKGCYHISFLNRWVGNENPEQLLVLSKTLKHKIKPIFDIDYLLSYSSADLKSWEKEIAFRISVDVYLFDVYFRYSLKEFGQVEQSCKMGISVKI